MISSYHTLHLHIRDISSHSDGEIYKAIKHPIQWIKDLVIRLAEAVRRDRIPMHDRWSHTVVRNRSCRALHGRVRVGGVFDSGCSRCQQLERGLRQSRTIKVPTPLSLELFPPPPHGVKDETHAHATLHLQLQRAVCVVNPVLRFPRPSSATPP